MEIKKKNPTKKPFSLSASLVVLVTSIVVFLMTVSVFVFATTLNSSLVDTATTNSAQSVEQAKGTLNLYASQIKQSVDLGVKKIATANSRNEVKEYIDTMAKTNGDIAAIMIYDLNGNLLEYGAGDVEIKQDLSNNLSFNKELFAASADYCITAPHIQNIFKNYYPWVVTVARNEWAGCYNTQVYIVMDMKFSSIASYIDNVGIGQHGYCFLMDTKGNIVYHPQQQLLYAGIKSENLDVLHSFINGVSIHQNTIYTVQDLDISTWKVVGVSFVDELVGATVRQVVKIISLISLCCVLIAVIMIMIFSKIVSSPIRSLVNAMHDFEKNAKDFQYKRIDGIGEINMLSQSFEHMVIRIQELMDKVKNEEITLRKTELKALQAQINPHFLYNTLDSIQWMCEQNKMQDAVQMVGALAQLFRISISKGKELITIEKEIHHAESYLLIQSFRYKNQFVYKFDVDPKILNYMCNKITLQPIIENAIYHGISAMVDEGEIIISAKSDGNDIVFEVKDNGVGMTEEQCKSILLKDLSDNSGIGIKNVNDRIKIYFGADYGISIHSVLDEGTTITIRFPKIEGGQI